MFNCAQAETEAARAKAAAQRAQRAEMGAVLRFQQQRRSTRAMQARQQAQKVCLKKNKRMRSHVLRHVQEERQRLVELQQEEQLQEAALQELRAAVVAAGADPKPLDLMAARRRRAATRL